MSAYEGALRIIKRLCESGFSAYLVGGCVRDMLRHTEPVDYDIATSALPEQVKAALDFCRAVDTGIKHGTVTAICGGVPYEITTFRGDGKYLDSRRPESVAFISNIEDDLARRDFTMNSVAMTASGRLIDPFNGAKDIQEGVIRCVGSPQTRFSEDALRILRAVRFTSRLGFQIEPSTEAAMLELSGSIARISNERVASELLGILSGGYAREALLRYKAIIFNILPELEAADGFMQHSRMHSYDIYTHTCYTVGNAANDPASRLAALLHDIAKPACFALTDGGEGHFYGHDTKGAEMADEITKRLKLDNRTRERVKTLIRYHMAKIEPNERAVTRWASRLGIDCLEGVVKLMLADDLSKRHDMAAKSIENDRIVLEIINRMRENRPCLTVGNLAINGNDMLALGLPQGPAVGRALSSLLNAVLNGQIQNNRNELVNYYLNTLANNDDIHK